MNGFMDKLAQKIMPLANLLGAKSLLDSVTGCIYVIFPFNNVRSIVVVFNNLPFFSDATKGTLSAYLEMGKMQQ